MNKKYEFSKVAFHNTYLRSMILTYVGIQAFIQICMIFNNTWNPILAMIYILSIGGACCCLYIKQKRAWSFSYVAIVGSKVFYYRKQKVGIEEPLYDFKERTAVIHEITDITISPSRIIVKGCIEESINMGPRSSTSTKRYISKIRIRRYLENENELIHFFMKSKKT